jgi:colanic acid biosynthesis protein WcaH
MKNFSDIIRILKSKVTFPEKGLPEEIFLWISSVTPMVNVDLLIKDNKGRVLLTWREKMYHFEAGWHIPGGVVRYKETMAQRIKKVAKIELGTEVKWKPKPLAIKEIIIPELSERAHFISFLFECKLIRPPAEELRYKGGTPKPGEWKWFSECPENLFEVHKIYKEFLPG